MKCLRLDGTWVLISLEMASDLLRNTAKTEMKVITKISYSTTMQKNADVKQ